MKNVAVIGAGTMGNGIAHTFAQNDYKVQLIDVSRASLDSGLATIAKNLDLADHLKHLQHYLLKWDL